MRPGHIVVAVVLVLGACGGGESASEPVATPTPDESVVATEPSVPIPTVSAASTTALDTTPTSSSPTTVAAPTTTEFIDITDAEPWRVSLSEPTGQRLDGWVEWVPTVPDPTAPPDGLDARLAWIYKDLIELWRDDARLPAVGLVETAFDSTHRELAPQAMIDVLGSMLSLSADSYAVIAAHAELVASPEPEGFVLTLWAEHAALMAAATGRATELIAEARDLDRADQTCFISVLDGDECEGAGAELATTLGAELAEFDEEVEEVDLYDPGSYTMVSDFDECRAWDDAVAATGLTPDEELRIWIALDDSQFDEHFVSLSECGSEDGPEDPEIDDTAFIGYLEAVAKAILETGYDETIYDMGSGAEDEKRYYEAVSAETVEHIVNVARDEASHRLSMVWPPELAMKLYLVTAIEIDDWVDLHDWQLDWDDLGAEICEVWPAVVSEYGDDEQGVFDAAANALDLYDTVIPDYC